MILKLVEHQEASTLPFVAGVILLVVVILMTSLVVSSISEERTDQQAIADAAALSGANVMAKANQTVKMIKLVVWTRNVVLNILYLATAIACIAAFLTGGTLTSICGSLGKFTHRFKSGTDKAVNALETTITGIEKTAPLAGMVNSALYVEANNLNNPDDTYYGLAIPFPWPIDIGFSGSSESSPKDISEMDKIKKRMSELTGEKSKRESEIRLDTENEGLNDDELKAIYDEDSIIKDITKEIEGYEDEVEKLAGEDAEETKKALKKELDADFKSNGGQDGMVAIVLHMDNEAKFSSFFGGQRSGVNVAIGAAKSQNHPDGRIIGMDAMKNMLKKVVPGLGEAVGGALDWLLKGVNILAGNVSNLGVQFAGIGEHITTALERLGLRPPDITEERPILITTREATKHDLAKLQSFIDKIKDFYEKINNQN